MMLIGTERQKVVNHHLLFSFYWYFCVLSQCCLFFFSVISPFSSVFFSDATFSSSLSLFLLFFFSFLCPKLLLNPAKESLTTGLVLRLISGLHRRGKVPVPSSYSPPPHLFWIRTNKKESTMEATTNTHFRANTRKQETEQYWSMTIGL